ncbi:hypothetical protein AFM11_23610 [Mycolicibacterium wolinskyi]|uniref:Uncharacterized protein n=1 Tax=Mycolicibacterium wolinskyi TaxID=59750 RepID=A0A132PHM1_9MYCO|nr:hypothetical protein AFM11_23610 [Mycolicibacterium wolinskyi]
MISLNLHIEIVKHTQNALRFVGTNILLQISFLALRILAGSLRYVFATDFCRLLASLPSSNYGIRK